MFKRTSGATPDGRRSSAAPSRVLFLRSRYFCPEVAELVFFDIKIQFLPKITKIVSLMPTPVSQVTLFFAFYCIECNMPNKSVMTIETPDEVCGTIYAAKLLGLSVGSVQALVEKNELQAWKTKGGHRRISMQSIRDYQRQHGVIGAEDRGGLIRVIVVDDDPGSLEVFRAELASWRLPIDCITMSSALEAIIDIGSVRPDVLITDLRMPGVDGFELLRILDSNPNFASLLVVALTGLSPEDISREGGVPPHTIVVQKPIDMKWLHGFFTSLAAGRRVKST